MSAAQTPTEAQAASCGGAAWRPQVGVVIPARNEVALIGRCLEAVLKAVDRAHTPCSVLVVDDGSDDGTGEVARAMLRPERGGVLRIAAGNVGAARAAGIESLAAGGSRAPDWLACTDADSVVPSDWLARQLEHAAAGADAVAGLVDVDSGHDDPLRLAFAERYSRRLSKTGHRHVHGANLGFRLSSYAAVGGFAPLRCGEDRDLWGRFRSAGYRTVADSGSVVTTSARLISRTTGGFATDLRQLAVRGG